MARSWIAQNRNFLTLDDSSSKPLIFARENFQRLKEKVTTVLLEGTSATMAAVPRRHQLPLMHVAGILLLLLHPFAPAAASEVNLDNDVTDPQPSPPDAGETSLPSHARTLSRGSAKNCGDVRSQLSSIMTHGPPRSGRGPEACVTAVSRRNLSLRKAVGSRSVPTPPPSPSESSTPALAEA